MTAAVSELIKLGHISGLLHGHIFVLGSISEELEEAAALWVANARGRCAFPPYPYVIIDYDKHSSSGEHYKVVEVCLQMDDLRIGVAMLARLKGQWRAVTDEMREAHGLLNPGLDVLRMLLACKNVSSEVVKAPPTSAGNQKKRIARGDPPLYDYHVLTIDGRRVQDAGDARQGKGATGIIKRAHWVRGHVRHFEDGSSTFVIPHMRGDITRGFVRKDYEVKHDR